MVAAISLMWLQLYHTVILIWLHGDYHDYVWFVPPLAGFFFFWPLFLMRLDALERSGDWPALLSAMEEAAASLSDPIRLALEALALKKQDQNVKAIVKWQKAFRVASDDEEKNWFYLFARIAGRMENRDGQMESIIRAVGRRGLKPPTASALTPIFAWLMEQADQERILTLPEEFLRQGKDNPPLLNNSLFALGQENGARTLSELVDHDDFSAKKNEVLKIPELVVEEKSGDKENEDEENGD